MATITEDYVSFETAKLLKEKGFNELCDKKYYGDDGSIPSYIRERWEDGGDVCPMSNSDLDDGSKYADISAPTLQMAMKWLMENHNICIVSLPVVTDDEGEAGCLWNYIISKKLKTLHNSEGLYEASEFALSNGLKYALKNLI